MSFLRMSPKQVLLKHGWRRDSLWTNPLFNTVIARRVPFYADVRALEKSQYWSREEMDTYVWERTRMIVKRASRLPFWKSLLADHGINPDSMTREDFLKLPVISKRDFKKETRAWWTDGALMKSSFTDHTSGSTGVPFDFYLDKGFELRAFAICERMLRTATGGDRLPVVSLRPREKIGFVFFNHHLFFVQNYNNIKNRLPALAELMASIKSEVILYGFPSAFIELARRVKEAGLSFKVRAAISTGESIRPSERALIEENLHTKFFTNYATRELGWLAFECERRVLHLNEEWAFVEIVDDDGNVLPPGNEGNIVTTVFENSVMPTVRYSNGDRGVISDEPCPCGRTLRTIKVSGRQIEFITFEDGRTVSMLDLSTVFDWFSGSVEQFRIEQTGAFDFLVKVIPGPNFTAKEKLLEQKLVHLLHPSAKISWKVVDEILAAKSGKAVYFTAYGQTSDSDHVQKA